MKGESHAFECCQVEISAERRNTVEWEREGRLCEVGGFTVVDRAL